MGLESGGQKVTSCCDCVSGGRRSIIPCTHGFLRWLKGVWVSVCVCVCWFPQAQDAIWPLTSGRRLRRRFPQWQPADKQRGLKRFPSHSLSTFVSLSRAFFFSVSPARNRHLQHDHQVSSSGCKHSPFIYLFFFENLPSTPNSFHPLPRPLLNPLIHKHPGRWKVHSINFVTQNSHCLWFAIPVVQALLV